MAKYELTLQDHIQLAIEYQNYENLGKIRPDSMLYNQAALHRATVLEEISFARAINVSPTQTIRFLRTSY